MSELCIQIQTDRAPDLPLGHIRRVCERIASDRKLVSRLAWVDATGARSYVNVLFRTTSVDALWDVLQRELYGDSRCGQALEAASLAMCVGQHGWNDSRQLHPPVSQVA